MLLSVSLISSVIVGVIGFVSGRESLRAAAIDQLTTIRELRTGEIESAMAGVQRGVSLDSRNLSAQTASLALNAAFDELQSRTLTPAEEAQLEAYYADSFIPDLEKRSGQQYGDTAFIPTSNAGKWLQYHYTAQFKDFDQALATDDGHDGTSFSSAAMQYGDYLSRLVSQVGYEDLLLMNLDGDVVYSAYKGVDLGTNLNDGPYRDSVLAKAYRTVIATNSVDAVETTDFERYVPSLNVPTIWVVSPVGNNSRVTGALAAQVPLSTINDVMTGSGKWAQQGLGKTGEVYLAGRDDLMRSISRELVEHPKSYAADVVANGTPPTVAHRVVQVGGTVQLQPVDTYSVNRAQQGKTGTAITQEYIGSESITAYAPARYRRPRLGGGRPHRVVGGLRPGDGLHAQPRAVDARDPARRQRRVAPARTGVHQTDPPARRCGAPRRGRRPGRAGPLRIAR